MGGALRETTIPAPAWAGVPDGTPYVDSKTRPIRVYYEAARVKQPDAEGFLAPLEDAWTATVDGMGFAVPKRLVDLAVAPGFDLYIKYFSGDYGMTFEVLGDDPSTPEADCPTLGVVNSRVLSMAGVGLEVAWHLLNHASMHATDCLEPALPAYDMFTLADSRTDTDKPLYRTGNCPFHQHIRILEDTIMQESAGWRDLAGILAEF